MKINDESNYKPQKLKIMKIKTITILTLSFAFAIISTNLQAQVTLGNRQTDTDRDVEFGVKAGLNLATIAVEDVDENNFKAGFHAGVSAKFPLSESFALQPEVLFTQKGVKTTYDADFLGFDVADGETTYNLNYVDIPIYAVYNFTDNFNLHLGPYLGILVDASVDTQTEVLDFVNIDNTEEINEDRFNSITYGLTGGLGFELGMISIGANYNLGLAPVAEEDDIAEELIGEATNNVIQIYIGIIF